MFIKIVHNQSGFIHALLVLLMLIGVGIGVYLIQTGQIFKSRASNTINDVFKFEDDSGNEIHCSDDGSSTYLCYSDTNTVDIKIKDLDQITK